MDEIKNARQQVSKACLIELIFHASVILTDMYFKITSY